MCLKLENKLYHKMELVRPPTADIGDRRPAVSEKHRLCGRIEDPSCQSPQSNGRQALLEQLAEHSDAKRFEDALDEWDCVAYQEVSCECICGQGIEHAFTLRHEANETELVLGKDCLKALGSPLLTDTAKILRRMEGADGKRVCASCLKLRLGVNAEAWKLYCSACSKTKVTNQAYKNLYYRECSDCGDKAIEPSAPAWKKVCNECREVKKGSCRECESCGQKRISPKESEYTKICFPCKKDGGMKACSGCGLFNLYALGWQKTCIDCYKKGK